MQKSQQSDSEKLVGSLLYWFEVMLLVGFTAAAVVFILLYFKLV